MSTTSDTDLVTRLRNGDISAGGVLYERYKRHIFNYVAGMLRDDNTAHDAVQQTFITMIEKIGTLKTNASFRHWLFTIARNEALMALRRQRAINMDGLDAAERLFVISDAADAPLVQNETTRLVYNALDCLTPEYREIIILQMHEQLSYEEIASITNTTVASVRSKLYKAKLSLAKLLSPDMMRED